MMKKILFTLPALYAGGAERVLITLMNSLDPSRFQVKLFAFHEGPMQEWVRKDIPVHIPLSKYKINALPSLYSEIKAFNPDIVVSTVFHMNTLALILKPLFPHIRFAIRETTSPEIIIKEYGLKGRLCHYIYRYIYPAADMIICQSQKIARQFQNKLFLQKNRFLLLYNPVDEEKIHHTIPEFFPHSAPNQINFVCAGRLVYEKGFDLLIEHLKGVPFSCGWRLDILGEGENYNALQTQIKRCNLEDKIFLQGHQENPWKWIAAADVFLLSSRWEGLPNVVLESLSCGTKVIAMRTAGAIAEIAEDLQPQDIQIVDSFPAFVEAMQQTKPLGKKQKERSLLPKRFSLPHALKIFEDALQAL